MKTYLIKSLDNKPITLKTESNLLKINVKDEIKVRREPYFLDYDLNQIENPQEIITPSIVMFIRNVDHVNQFSFIVTDGGKRRYLFEEYNNDRI